MRKKNNRLTERFNSIASSQPVVSTAPRVRSTRMPRETDRVTCYRYGKIKYGNFEPVQVVIKDVSPGGARIVLEHASKLPSTILLKAPSSGIMRKCLVVWQRGHSAGVKFI
ncbi:MAG: PilZ domain-containing protein [Aquisalinus sp.]|nr:PilZ domain-containing protein [Aquisalinus sp.]